MTERINERIVWVQVFKALNIQRGEFGPNAVVAQGVGGLELAIRMHFELSGGRPKPGPSHKLGEGALPPPGLV